MLQIDISTNASPNNDEQNDHNGKDHANFWTVASLFCLLCIVTGSIPTHSLWICEIRLLITVHG